MPRSRAGAARSAATALIFVTVAALASANPAAQAVTRPMASGATTAWQAGHFSVDTADLVESSDVFLGTPNTQQSQAMPLGNGTLGAAVWAAGGFTAQLNRSDTLPDRLSPGWLTIPGLAALTGAANFTATLNLYDGTLVESGGGMTATIYVRADKDELVVDVTGANPNTAQTAQISLWSPRAPQVQAGGGVASLAETWVDNTQPGSSGRTFGSLAALTAGGVGVTASTVNSEAAQVSFKPNANGTFQVVVVAPPWTGGNGLTTGTSLLGSDATTAPATLEANHLAWWHNFWSGVDLIDFSSSDGSANYLGSLRTLDLYDNAADSRGQFPGTQAGVGNLFSAYQDSHQWDPAAYWQWNLRMQVQANIDAGAYSLNTPYFQLYQQNIPAIQAWTTANMGGRTGICVPETMRFNGNGYEYETWLSSPGLNCDAASQPYYNARTITTGAEVGLWVWQQYLYTGNKSFLTTNYPLMEQAAEFLLAYATTGSDGKLHTSPSNAHETQWDVTDPTTDIAAMQALFPATIKAANILGTDSSLVSQLTAAEAKIQPFARTDAATQTQLLTASSDAGGQDVIAPSYDPAAAQENSENIGLEPVWPYGVIGDNSSLTALAQRTYNDRPNKEANDWSDDPIQAARLDMGSAVSSTLIALTEQYQKLPSGMATFVGNEPYAEQQGVVSAALSEAFAQDYDGLLRIAPAMPAGWSGSGTVAIQGGGTVSIQDNNGTIGTVGINAGSTGTINVRNPWPGQSVEVVNGTDEKTVVVAPTTAAQFAIPAQAGQSYLVQLVSAPVSGLTFSQLDAAPATAYRTLGSVSIGLPGGTSTGGSLTGTHTVVTSGEALDDPNWSTSTGVQLDTWVVNGGANQNWTFALQTDGTYTLTNAYSGLCMDVSGASTSAGGIVIQWTCSGSANQRWIATALSGGGYTLASKSSGLLLTTSSTSNGGLLTQQANTNSALQHWTIN